MPLLTYQLITVCACFIIERKNRARGSARKGKKEKEEARHSGTQFNPSTWKAEAGREFEASQVNLENSRAT